MPHQPSRHLPVARRPRGQHQGMPCANWRAACRPHQHPPLAPALLSPRPLVRRLLFLFHSASRQLQPQRQPKPKSKEGGVRERKTEREGERARVVCLCVSLCVSVTVRCLEGERARVGCFSDRKRDNKTNLIVGLLDALIIVWGNGGSAAVDITAQRQPR